MASRILKEIETRKVSKWKITRLYARFAESIILNTLEALKSARFVIGKTMITSGSTLIKAIVPIISA